MTHTIYIQNQRYQLDAADLIQSGGEGMVFGLGNTAVKLYHQPTAAQQNKLRHWFAQRSGEQHVNLNGTQRDGAAGWRHELRAAARRAAHLQHKRKRG